MSTSTTFSRSKLQEQQGTVQRILKEQQNLCVLVKDNEKWSRRWRRLNEETNPSVSSSGGKKTRTVTRDFALSVNLHAHVHAYSLMHEQIGSTGSTKCIILLTCKVVSIMYNPCG